MKKLIAGVLLLLSVHCHAIGLGIAGIYGIAGQSSEPDRYTGRWNFGEIAFVRFSIAPGLKLDAGIQLHRRTYRILDLGDFSYGTVEPQALVRFSLLPWLSVGAGASGAILSGKKTDASVAALAPDVSGIDPQLLAAVTLEWALTLGTSLFLETRGSLGLVDLDRSATGILKTRGLGFAAGACFEL